METVTRKNFALNNATFGQKVFFSIMVVAAMSVLLVAVPVLYNSSDHYENMAVNQAHSDAVMMSSMLAPVISFERPDMAAPILELLRESNGVLSAKVFAFNKDHSKLELFAKYGEQTGEVALVDSNETELVIENHGNYLLAVSPIVERGERVGYLQMQVSLAEVQEHVRQTLVYMLLAGGVATIIAVYLAHLARISIVRPVGDLSRLAQSIAATKTYDKRAAPGNQDEIGELITSFNTMLDVIESYDAERKEKEAEILHLNQNLERKVKERTEELQKNMEALANTIQTLKDTQAKLVEQEKMASLGGLVAGVAHEINTPIGVAITAASHLDQSVQVLQQQFLSGSLTKRQFADAVAELNETGAMILKNLERAAKLVKSFKLVAVDQSNDDMRDFDIKEYMDSVLVSLQPRLKRTSHRVVTDIPDNLVVESSPGAISQIVTNLVMNSLIHGFEERENGQIDIRIQEAGSRVTLDYYDNGKGVPAHIKPVIFDPFVTTARSKGGSGLGTHILYNLVTQVLGGSVKLMDDVATGVHFHIEFPVKIVAPVVQRSAAGGG